MVIGIVGSRRRNTITDKLLVEAALINVLTSTSKECSLVSGGCPQGGDRFAEELAEEKDLSIKIHRAEWNKRGRGAGYYRNTFIANDADVLIACVAPDRLGGTEDTIRKFLAREGHGELILV